MTRSTRTQRRWQAAHTLALAVLLLAPAIARAQSVALQVPPSPHYLGDPIQIQIVAEGFDEEPTPQIEAPDVAQGRLLFRGVSPSVSSSIVIVGGQIKRSKEVKFVFTYELRVDRAGSFSMGPFVVMQNANRAATRAVPMEFRDVPSNERIAVELVLPDTPVYLGERVPVTVRFRLSGKARSNLHRYTLRVPLFDLTDSFRFLEAADSGDTDVKIQTASGEINLKGRAQASKQRGEEALVVTVQRVLVPLRDGPLAIPATVLDVEEGTRFRRDLFGGRQATHVRKWRATDRARRFEVKRIPAERTPPSFGGAVGTGFSLRVSADRTVVQVGEPIALKLELRGDGNLETASLPPLDARGLLPPTQFRVPESELAGQLADGSKEFTAMVRVIDENVTEIPAMEYSWFDPATETFHSTQSRPIALSVRDAQIVGAAQVERDPVGAPVSPGEPQASGAATTSRTGLMLTGADLAIERNPARLVRAVSGESGGHWGVSGLYLGTVLLVAVAQLDRRRRQVDPALIARGRRIDEQLQRIRAAGKLPPAEAAGALASALRALVSEVPGYDTTDVDAFVGECDAQSYAPSAQRSAEKADTEFLERARELADRIAEYER